MSRTEGKNLRVILYEGPGSTPLGNEARYQMLTSLLDDGFEVTRPVVGQAVAPSDNAPLLVLGLLDILDYLHSSTPSISSSSHTGSSANSRSSMGLVSPRITA